MPLKRAVLPLLDHASDLVTVVGAANTVVFGAEGITGHNTDVHGIVAALRGAGAEPGPAVIIGAGGAERVIEIDLNAVERNMFIKSVESVKGLVDACTKIAPQLGA